MSSDAIQRTFGGGGGQNEFLNIGDAFLTVLNASGTAMVFSTYLGGSQDDTAQAIALDNAGSVYFAGNTLSRNLPGTAAAFQGAFGGAGTVGRVMGDAFLTKFSGFTVTPSINAVVNAASNTPGLVSPGMIFVVYGSGVGPAQLTGGSVSNGKVTANAGGVRILINGIAAPILYVSSAASAGVIPYEVSGSGAAQIIVEVNGVQSTPFQVPVVAAVPALFSINYSGSGQGAILNEDLTLNSASNPAPAGSVITLFGTGEGLTNPAGVDGQVAVSTFPVPQLQPASVTIGGQAATDIPYAGAAPAAVAGALQINVRIPANLSSGNQPVRFSVGSFQSQPNLTVAVK